MRTLLLQVAPEEQNLRGATPAATGEVACGNPIQPAAWARMSKGSTYLATIVAGIKSEVTDGAEPADLRITMNPEDMLAIEEHFISEGPATYQLSADRLEGKSDLPPGASAMIHGAPVYLDYDCPAGSISIDREV